MRASTISKRLPQANGHVNNSSFNPSPLLVSSFSSSGSSGSRGRGRGRDGGVIPSFPGRYDFAERDQDNKNLDEEKPADFFVSRFDGIGRGRGSGKPSVPNRFLPDLSLFGSSQSGIGRGREIGKFFPDPPPDSKSDVASLGSRIDLTEVLPVSILSAYSGTGRGKSGKSNDSISQVKEENRHIRARTNFKYEPRGIPPTSSAQLHPKLSREEAVKKAMSVLSRGRGGGGPGKGRGRGRERERGRRDGKENRATKESDKKYATGLFLGDNADGERLANRIGAENMGKLMEGFEEMSDRLLPCPWMETFLDALDTNYMFEFEPEFMLGEIDQNPDIDEKPPLPIRDMLEKVKPFLVAYEGIQSQQEWEDAVENILKNVPLMKEIVEHYAGPERVTAKKQEEELERLVETVPASVPLSVKQFANRAYLSLKSNPGWEFKKKCQFMDKLVCELSTPGG